MSEYEFLEAGTLFLDGILESSLNIIYVTFGYLAAAHFIGTEIKKTVACFLSFIYGYWILVSLYAIWNYMSMLSKLSQQYSISFPEGWIWELDPNFELILVFATIPLVLASLGSIYYLHHIKRK